MFWTGLLGKDESEDWGVERLSYRNPFNLPPQPYLLAVCPARRKRQHHHLTSNTHLKTHPNPESP